MSESQDTDEFAYGKNQLDGCGCPAVTVGIDPSIDDEHPGLHVMIEAFDEIMSRRIDDVRWSSGIVSNGVAKDGWLTALESLQNRDDRDKAVEVGKQIARDLDWLEEE